MGKINDNLIFCDGCEAPISGGIWTEDENELLTGKKFCNADCAEAFLSKNRD